MKPKYKKQILAFAISSLLIFSFAKSAYATLVVEPEQNGNVTFEITSIEMLKSQIFEIPAPRGILPLDLQITGSIPYANIAGHSELSEQLNEIFQARHNAFISARSAAVLELNFGVELIVYNNFLSIVQTKFSRSISETQSVSATVIDFETMQIINLSHFGENTISLINNHINSMVAANPLAFVPHFAEISNATQFYIINGQIVIPFASGTLFALDRNIFNVVINKNNIHNVAIKPPNFLVLPPSQYNTIILDLNHILPLFGYEIRETVSVRNFAIFRDNSRVANLTIGLNRYALAGRGAAPARTLEVAPSMRAGSVFVPLSFVREFLNISAYVSSSGIILSTYRN